MTKVNPRMGGGGTSNLVPDFKGANFKIDYQGLQQTAFLLAAVTNRDLPVNIKASNSRQIGILTERARSHFESDIRRPNESGERTHRRETGNFTFGSRGGGTFVGVPIIDEENDTYGFGYPDIRRADQRTNYVWRSLEFGLAPHPAAIKHEFGPVGRAVFPTRFTFLPFSGQGGVLQPRASGSSPTGTLVTPRGRVVRRVAHPGIAPKQFITRAFNETVQGLRDGYNAVIGQTYKDFK